MTNPWMHRIGVILAVTAVASSACVREPGSDYFWNEGTARKTYGVKFTQQGIGTVEGKAFFRQGEVITIGSNEYHTSVTTYDGIPGLPPQTSYSRLGKDGIYSRITTDPSAEEALEIPLPARVGRKWIYKNDVLHLDKEIVGFEDLDTSEGIYRHCLKIAGKGNMGSYEAETTDYFCSKVGLVRQWSAVKGLFVLEVKLIK